MEKRWFPHGKWPKFYVWLHHYSIISFIALMVTGIALYIPYLHVKLIRYLSTIYDVHIFLGIVFFVSLFSPIVKKLSKTNRIRIIDWFMPILIGMAIVITGLPLWKIDWFSASVREYAFDWHGNLSYLLGIWLLAHGLFKAFGIKYPETKVSKKIDPDRRQFLRWGATGLVGGVIAMFPFSQMFFSRGELSIPTDSSDPSSNRGVHQFPEYFTVTDSYPKVIIDKYRLQIDGLVATPKYMTLDQLTSLPTTKQSKDFQCVTGWAVSNVGWEGIHLGEIVKLVEPTPDAAFVTFYSADGAYTESLTFQEAMESDVMLAFKMDNQPLRIEQGYPIRLVVPRMYGYKSIKWVNRVEFASNRVHGYWEQRGYPDDGTI